MESTGRQVLPCTAATRNRTCGATKRIIVSTPGQFAGGFGTDESQPVATAIAQAATTAAAVAAAVRRRPGSLADLLLFM
jgi:xanthine dehydrogenase molybdopterin-binding subunit B